jgi:hypothetical protein
MMKRTRESAALDDKSYTKWNTEEVLIWLDSIDLSELKQIFTDNRLQGRHLDWVRNCNLVEELGIKAKGHQLTLRWELEKLHTKKLKIQTAPVRLPPLTIPLPSPVSAPMPSPAPVPAPMPLVSSVYRILHPPQPLAPLRPKLQINWLPEGRIEAVKNCCIIHNGTNYLSVGLSNIDGSIEFSNYRVAISVEGTSSQPDASKLFVHCYKMSKKLSPEPKKSIGRTVSKCFYCTNESTTPVPLAPLDPTNGRLQLRHLQFLETGNYIIRAKFFLGEQSMATTSAEVRVVSHTTQIWLTGTLDLLLGDRGLANQKNVVHIQASLSRAPRDGSLWIGLYPSNQTVYEKMDFLTRESAGRVVYSSNTGITFMLNPHPPGTYLLKVYHKHHSENSYTEIPSKHPLLYTIVGDVPRSITRGEEEEELSDPIEPAVQMLKTLASKKPGHLLTGSYWDKSIELELRIVPFHGEVGRISRCRSICVSIPGKRSETQKYAYLGVEILVKSSSTQLSEENLKIKYGSDELMLSELEVSVACYEQDRVTLMPSSDYHLCSKTSEEGKPLVQQNSRGRPAKLCSFCNGVPENRKGRFSVTKAPNSWNVDLRHFSIVRSLKNMTVRGLFLKITLWGRIQEKKIELSDWTLWQEFLLHPHPSTIDHVQENP